MHHQDTKKTMYFNIENFVNLVLTSTGLDKAEPEIIEQISAEIAETLSNRVSAVVVSSLTEQDLDLLQRISIDHPELSKIDALTMIAPSVPGLNERILKSVSDLYDEMVQDVKTIDEVFKNKN